ncbi:hypothetical protein [Aquimarina aggregata]|uniref:hypothetical protein n=1 Tax=Aquimarina aggregata TaxID=1642818 RepID=UPI0024921204|nr:hypothetical protein [Aquimarina aggregata]
MENKIDITNHELFDSLLDIDYGKLSHFDIHNDFNLFSIGYKEGIEFVLNFKSINEKSTFLSIVFKSPRLINFDITLNYDNLTLDNFHRGRYEYEGELFDEYDDKKCFYLEFYGTGGINILSSEVFIEMSKKIKIIDLNKNAI